jgi:septum site-determining protein MinD
MLSTDDVLELLAIKLIGVIPEDESVIVASNRGQPVTFANNSKAGQAFHNIAKRLLGEEVPFMDIEANNGFINKLAKMMKFRGD